MAKIADEYHTAEDPISGCKVRIEPIYDLVDGARKIRVQYDDGPPEIADVDELMKKCDGKFVSMAHLSMMLLWFHVRGGHS